MLIFFSLAVLLVGVAIATDKRRRVTRDEADDLEAARLRLVAAGEDPDAVHAYRTSRYSTDVTVPVEPTVYTSRHAIDTAPPPVVIDPTVVEHVAPGAGSLTSFAATVEDTRMRTSAQLKELQAAEVAAYEAAPAEEDRLFFAGFEQRMGAALARFDEATGRVDQWEAYQHRDNEHECPHCLQAVKETSDEYRLIRSLDDTGAISRAEIAALYADA
jgi:hypothetical protein